MTRLPDPDESTFFRDDPHLWGVPSRFDKHPTVQEVNELSGGYALGCFDAVPAAELVSVPSDRAARLDVEPTDGIPEQESHEFDLAERDEEVVVSAEWGDGLPAILPAWATTPAGVRAYTAWRARRGGHIALYYGLRSPLAGARLSWWAVRGTGRGIRTWWRWVSVAELHDRLIGAENDGMFNLLDDKRTARQKVRGTVTGLAVAATGAGLTAETLLLPGGGLLLAVETVGALALAARNGRPLHDDAQALIAAPELPAELSVDISHLDAAFRAAGLLKGKDGADDAQYLNAVRWPMFDGKGWSAIIDLPPDSGVTAAKAIAARESIAAALGVDEIQIDMRRVRAADGGHAGRVSVWVCDGDPFLTDEPVPSPLTGMERFDFWTSAPFGTDARGHRVHVPVIWESWFFGGLPRRGKTAAQRLIVAAGVLDPSVRHWVADFKGGADWRPMRKVAHRIILGASSAALTALETMLTEIIEEIERAYDQLGELDVADTPDAKITPDLVARLGLTLNLITIDELQEALAALDKQTRERVVELLARVVRRGPAVGYICVFASQRPDADSVPAPLRDVVSMRFCTQVFDKTSSDMVLGKGAAARGADASVLSEEHKGIGVLGLGPDRHAVVRTDYMNLVAFDRICDRGRDLREQARTLTGDALGSSSTSPPLRESPEPIPLVLADALTLVGDAPGIHTDQLLPALQRRDERYRGWDAARLAIELDKAGVRRTGSRKFRLGGSSPAAGYRREDLQAAAQHHSTP